VTANTSFGFAAVKNQLSYLMEAVIMSPYKLNQLRH